MASDDAQTVTVSKMPYSERQLLIVTEDALAKAARREERAAGRQQPDGIDWAKIVEAAARDFIPLPFASVLWELSREAIRAWGRARASGLQVLAIGKTEASNLNFPPGHPRDGVLYIGHPAKPSVYYTTAE